MNNELRMVLYSCILVIMITLSPVMAVCGPSKGLFSGATMDITLNMTSGSASDIPQNLDDKQKGSEVSQKLDDWVSIGETLIRTGDYKEALNSFDKALAINDTDERAWNGKVTARINLENEGYDESLTVAHEAVEKIPDSSNLYANLARIYQYRLEFGLAKENAQKAVDLDPENTNAQLMLAWAQIGTNTAEEALQTTDRILLKDPENSDVWYIRGEAYRELNRSPEALEAYSKSVEVNPSLSCGWWNKGANLAKSGQLDDALSTLEEWISYSPLEKGSKTTDLQCNLLGNIIDQYRSYDDYKKILPYYNDFITVDDSYKGTFINIIKYEIDTIYEEKGEEAVFQELDRLLQIYPEEPTLPYLYGYILDELDQPDKALTYYEKAYELDPDYTDAREAINKIKSTVIK